MGPEEPRITAEGRLPDDVVRRVQAEVRRQPEFRRLGTDDAAELMQDVLGAVVQRAPFRSARGAARFAAVVATYRIADLERRRRSEPEFVSLDEADEALDVAAFDDPAESAVLRAGFQSELARLDPPPTPDDMDAMAYPLSPDRPGTKREQDRIALRLHRVRKRLSDGVRDLLAPVVVPVGRWWQAIGTDPGAGYASIAAGALMGVVLGTVTPSAALPAGRPTEPHAQVRVSGGEQPARVGGASVPRPASPGAAIRKPSVGAPPAPAGRGGPSPTGERAPVSAHGDILRSDEAQGRTSVTTGVGWEGHYTAWVTMYCDSPVRAAVCQAVPPQTSVG